MDVKSLAAVVVLCLSAAPVFADQIILEGARLCREPNVDVRQKNIDKILEHLKQHKEVPEVHWKSCTDATILDGEVLGILEKLELTMRFQIADQPDLYYEVWENPTMDVVLFRKIREKEDLVLPESDAQTEDA